MYLCPVCISQYVLFAIENQDRHYLRISSKALDGLDTGRFGFHCFFPAQSRRHCKDRLLPCIHLTRANRHASAQRRLAQAQNNHLIAVVRCFRCVAIGLNGRSICDKNAASSKYIGVWPRAFLEGH